MRVRQVMTEPVAAAEPETTVQDAAVLMRDRNVGSIPICDPERHVVGMLTDRDIVIRVVAEGWDALSTKVDEVMSQGVVWCREDQDLSKCIQLMEAHGVRRLPVVNRSGRLTGLVSLDDLAVRAQQEREIDEVLRSVAHAAGVRRAA